MELKKSLLARYAFALAASIWAANAAAYILGGPEAADHSSTGSWNWENGTTTAPLRAALENPNFFGPGGIVEETVTTTVVDMDALNALLGLDGFIVPWWTNTQSAPYNADIVNFFLGGGDLWVLQDSNGRDGVGDALGVGTVGQTAVTPVNGTAPLFDGPFGVANNVGQGGGEEGFLSEADVLGNNGTIVGRNTEDQVVAAFWGPDQYAPGAGALIIVADIDMFTSQATIDGTFGTTFGNTVGELNDNGIFTLNAFAFLATSEEPIGGGGSPVPTPASIALVGLGLLAMGLRRRKGRNTA